MSTSARAFAIATAIVYLSLAYAEWQASARALPHPRMHRRALNYGAGLLGFLLVRLLVPTGLGALALESEQGLLTRWGISELISIPLFWVTMDFYMYWQHRLFHEVGFLWRFHAVHHADTEIDLSSAFRFHPGELLISLAGKAALVVLLGPPLVAVLLFESSVVWSSMWNHSNLRLPPRFETRIRRWFVTPSLHLVHHSIDPIESQRNYGNVLVTWDRWLGTYLGKSRLGARPQNGLRGVSRGRAESPTQQLIVIPWRGIEDEPTSVD